MASLGLGLGLGLYFHRRIRIFLWMNLLLSLLHIHMQIHTSSSSISSNASSNRRRGQFFLPMLYIDAFAIQAPMQKRSYRILPTSKNGNNGQSQFQSCSRLLAHQTQGKTQTQTFTFFNDLDTIYTEASTTIKCPFFRRRIADTIDNVAMIMRFLIIRHKSLWPAFGIIDATPTPTDLGLNLLQVPGCKAMGKHIQIDTNGKSVKHCNLPIETIRDVIVKDWRSDSDAYAIMKPCSLNKGYYITGKLNSTIYTDDCLFDGPDPDMPVKGLRKYLGAASNLFDSNKSSATLLDIQIIDVDVSPHKAKTRSRSRSQYGNKVVEVKWTMEGVLMLPWRPRVKPWSGWTRYYLDDNGLIAYHEEGWDISVMEAFVGTVLPELGAKIWGDGMGVDVGARP